MQIQSFASGNILTIDNGNVYSGMSKSYSAGYTPTTTDGKAVVVLPLVNNNGTVINGNQVTAKVELGGASSTFVYANYEKTFYEANNAVGDGSTSVLSYLVKFTLPLSSQRVNGTYPVIIDISYTTDAGDSYTQSHTIYFTITDGIDPNAPVATPTPVQQDRPRPEPKLIIQKYALSKEKVMAGEEFEIDLTLFNTQDRYHTYNILLTYTGESAEILPSGKSNAIYIDEIEDEETHDITLKMKARLDAEAKPYKVNISITYENSGRTAYTVTESIVIEVSQPIRIQHDEVNLSKTVNAGDSIPLSMQVINMGKSTLYNVLVSMDMKGAIPDASAYLGNMESGTSEMAEIYVFFGTLDMNSDSEEKYGYTDGKIMLTYEDENGKTYEEEIPISTTIERPVFEDLYKQDEPEEEEKQRAGYWWVSILVLLSIGISVFGAITYNRKVEKLRREYGDESI